MDLYYRDFSARSPVTTGTKWLGALLARIAVALVDALPSGWLTLRQIWVMSFLWAAWLAISVFPVSAPLANVINGILLTVGATKLVGTAKELGRALVAGLRRAYEARSDAELKEASELLAPVMTEVVLNGIATFAGGNAFRAIESAVLRMLPVPDWFSARYDEAIFFRDFNAREPVTSGVRFLAALTARIALALVASLEHTDVKKRLMLSAREAWVLALILAGWFVASILPGLAGLANAVNLILLGIGIVVLIERAREIGAALFAGLRGAYEAKSHADLEAAGKALAPAISLTLLTAIELYVTHQAFRAAEAAALRRFPMPEWFRVRFEKVAERLAKKTEVKAEPNQSLPPKQSTPEPNQSLPPERAAPEPNQSLPKERPAEEPTQSRPQGKAENFPKEEPAAAKVRRTVKNATQVAGARKGAELGADLPIVPLVVLGVVTAGSLAVVFLSSGRSR